MRNGLTTPVSAAIGFSLNQVNTFKSIICCCGFIDNTVVNILCFFFVWVFDLLFVWGPVNVTDGKEALGLHVGYGDTLLLRADGDSRGMTIVGFAYGAFAFSTLLFLANIGAFSLHISSRKEIRDNAVAADFESKLLAVFIVALMACEITKLILYCILLPDLPTLLGSEPLQARYRQPALWFNVFSIVLTVGLFVPAFILLLKCSGDKFVDGASQSLKTVSSITGSGSGYFSGNDYARVRSPANPGGLGRSRSLSGIGGKRSVYVPVR